MNEQTNANNFSFQSLENTDGSDSIYAENIKIQLDLRDFKFPCSLELKKLG